MSEAKPYSISKHLVVRAFRLVKANHGAAGVDGQSVDAFEEDLKGNLYKVWNRMSSGSYFSTTGSSGGNPQRRWPDAAVGYTDGGGPGSADGG